MTSLALSRSLPAAGASRWLMSLALATALSALAPMAFAQTATPAPEAKPAEAAAPAAAPATAPATAPEAKPAEAAAPAAAPEAKPTDAPAHSAADVMDAAGKSLGSVTIADTASGDLHVNINLKGLPPGGIHAIHIHETGKCEAPDFKSAGGHLSGGHDHGAMSPKGMHQGDLPNLTVAADGSAVVEYFAPGVTVADVTDADGGAIVVHAKPDDYKSQPAGEAGDRIACGVFSAAK